MTVDETVYLTGDLAPKKAKTVLWHRKAMATLFWDSQDVTYINYMEKVKMVTELYYEWHKKQPHLAKKKVLFHHDDELTVSRHDQIVCIRLQTTVFSIFGSVGLFFLSKLEKVILA